MQLPKKYKEKFDVLRPDEDPSPPRNQRWKFGIGKKDTLFHYKIILFMMLPFSFQICQLKDKQFCIYD